MIEIKNVSKTYNGTKKTLEILHLMLMMERFLPLLDVMELEKQQ